MLARTLSNSDEAMTTRTMMEVRVARKTFEAQDICTFELVDLSGGPLPNFSAGSHIDVEVGPGVVRQYSLCNDAKERHRYLIGILRDPNTRGGSARLHDHVSEGSVIRIGEPRNHFPLVHGVKHSLLLAGGIGVTPILCMAAQLAEAGANFEMHYCTRSQTRTAFRERILDSVFADKVHFHYDDGGPQQKVDIPALLATPDSQTHLYVCGPSGFLDLVISTAKANGWADSNVHFEYFTGKEVDASANVSFHVKIASTGKLIPVTRDQSVTAALLASGIEIPMSCESGVCGTCITRVLEGEIDHRDMYFTDDEKARNDQFTPCCSRAKSDLLVLDL
ncbi:PDR/VanB family oxidoreductase [Paraburkholderia sp. GAS334]|uniref:PDR/VanB family oxidoreductase n=1 Tax=Paraburkholderia sp. GAS334 TaxID=3035131 RepID=UPI003D1E540E